MGVDLLVDTRCACNLMPTALCKKLGLAMVPCAKTLVSFSGVVSKTIGVTQVEIKLGELSRHLQFHVIEGKVQPILGYPGLKEMNLGIDCGEDCLLRKDGKKIVVSCGEGEREGAECARWGVVCQSHTN